MYIHFAHQFLKEIQWQNCQDTIRYYEYFKKGWTFHGKGILIITSWPHGIIIVVLFVGLWYYLSGEEMPSLSFVGSSNFG